MTKNRKYDKTKKDIPLVAEEEAVYLARVDGTLQDVKLKPKLIDLFAGAGGMTLGFTKLTGHGFEPVWANDFNDHAARTYNANFGNHCIVGDIVSILENPRTKIPKADVVIGGPPCQGFSLLNKNRDDDPRKQLWRPYMDIVERSGASIFVMENVPQMLDSFEHGEIIGVAESLGFKLRWAKLCAADYGVSQTRWRAFIIGCKFADPEGVFPPKKTNYNINNGYRKAFSEEFDSYIVNPSPWRNVRDAIADLPPPVGTEIRDIPPPLDLHFGRTPTPMSMKRYRAIPKEGMNRFDLQKKAPDITPACWIRKTSGGTDLFGRLWWDRPSFTIRTEFFKPEKGRYLHPVQHRPITHREAARLQSFPDDFRFVGTKIEVAKQIGNAVPPLLAARIADCVYTLLLSKEINRCRTSSAGKKEAGLWREFQVATQSLK
ncbi:MAG: DNA (cytosine-5-)-methyltransferase [Nitrospirae bacterium CG_4_9_14_3_um_filter_53_35]|nr:MAG: DNA (cytosine-5-)-methyltransferase [Nitrospirae bacterium CG2_30_53_67]PIS37389.1 MAG: DNA (cytosine-5-)-methyltransferase [Nitrospirae bacterium CG08_land_8_20_14_0_20_52_24]PIV82773.1 MAG: DNA (cytosine-5-)-methyltransferase [Nitrospirae bacterium CG17_big_fil_post_rev_8_21_14_2_50_50_9]PIW85386.1 MAG: DNA (cytosine-5-)-methyltransferase [Nitrospirae bacterium CG_4_8_14_3_um_filter_50_41]PIX85340.1 MAG: DNA (cytosine-5-)-methyltransferase [Nitrospirae bacterium CG_4_10_14_3_um_filter